MTRMRTVLLLGGYVATIACGAVAGAPSSTPHVPPAEAGAAAKAENQQTAPFETAASAQLDGQLSKTEYFGGDISISGPQVAEDAVIQHDPRRGVELAFVDADIRRVIDVVLGDTLRLDYTVDPQVQGAITLRTARPVARESLFPALEAALATVNAAIIRRDAVYAVVPRSQAQSGAGLLRPLTGQERMLPGYALEIMPIQYASAREVAKLVTSSGAKDSILQIDEIRNQLLIVGPSAERSAVRRLVESVDLDWVRGMSFAIYRVESVEPEELVTDLERIFQPPMDLLGARVRLIPIPRMRAILGIAARTEDLRQLENWVRRLDMGSEQSARKLYIYNVQNGRARDLAASLQMVVLGENTGAASAASVSTSVSTGTNGQSQLNTAGITAGTVGFSSSVGSSMRIVPDEANNSVLLYATPIEYETLERALRQLDVLPRQILIEAVLAEVTLNDDLRYGLQWSFTPDGNQITLSTSSSGAVSSAFPGFSYVYTGWADARVVLNALQSKTDVKVLSSPKLVVLNNQTATLQVGDQVPIITQSAQGITTPDAPIVSTVELKDTGVILKVTPRANENGLVIMDISQEVSDVAPTTTSGIDSPTIQQRKFSSTIAGQSGATIALGGLIRETQTKSNSGVPLLKDIPLLGNAFKSTTKNARRTELIVLLTPKVMRDARETEQSINELIEGFGALRPITGKAMQETKNGASQGQP